METSIKNKVSLEASKLLMNKNMNTASDEQNYIGNSKCLDQLFIRCFAVAKMNMDYQGDHDKKNCQEYALSLVSEHVNLERINYKKLVELTGKYL